MESCTVFWRPVVHRYSPAMPVAVRDLLAEEALSLRLCAGAAGLDRVVRWVAVTELSDPTPWMEGGELILTTGLRQRTATAQTAFVDRLASAGAAGIGFGTGLSHGSVPRATVTAAERVGLPLLEVPYETPFIALNRLVADRISAESHSSQRRLVDQYDRLAQALLSGQGLAALVRTLHRVLRAQVAVVDLQGRPLATAPANDSAPLGMRTDLPVEVDGEVCAYLSIGPAEAATDVLPFAVRLIGLELARRRSFLAGRRELAGQILDDIIRDAISPAEAERRLAPFGVELRDPHSVIVGSSGSPPGTDETNRLRRLSWSPSALHDDPEPVITAVIGRCLVAVAPEGDATARTARHFAAALAAVRGTSCVGIGGAYPGMDGLRWSYFEAQAAMANGPGVHGGEPLNLPRLLISTTDLPLRRLGAQILQPLTEFDAEHNGDLVVTLYTYLAADCSVQTAADRLYVHRNTIRYRLDQIERLTGRSLHSTQERVQLWLALLGARFAPTDQLQPGSR